MKSESGFWREVLKAARTVVKREDRPLSSTSLSHELKIPVNVASAWLGKFERWGYARKMKKQPNGTGGRWEWIWELTRFGMEYRERKTKATLRIAANPPRNQG